MSNITNPKGESISIDKFIAMSPYDQSVFMRRGRSIHTKEHRAKMSASQKGAKRPKHSEETRAKISAGNKGKVVSEETRAKMRGQGRVFTEESRAKMSASQKGRVVSEETKAKLSAHYAKLRAEKLAATNM